jgi:hypothetical protein
MLQSIRMNYSKSLLLYQDKPGSGWILRFILLIVPILLFALSIYLWYSGESSGSLVLLTEGVIISLILWAILPRKYQVFEDHLSIVLGEPFKIKIGFDQITKIEVTTRTALTVNFVTRITRTYVIIIKKKGLSTAITPGNNELFVENAIKALSQWKKNNQG